jgi:DNA-binding response OmpR family regulator
MQANRRMRVLLVEDDAHVAETVCDALTARRAVVERAETIGAARDRLRDRLFDALILDLGLPDGCGLDLADALRAEGIDIPILMLTGRSDVSQRLEGFAHGADDYLCKPFDADELVARLAALLRRAQPERSHLLRYGGAELDLLKRTVTYEGTTSTLSDREASLLGHFMRHPEEVLSREHLAMEVFGLPADAESGVVNVYVNYLRNKLEQGQRYARLIHTVRGLGYVLATEEPGVPPTV